VGGDVAVASFQRRAKYVRRRGGGKRRWLTPKEDVTIRVRASPDPIGDGLRLVRLRCDSVDYDGVDEPGELDRH